MDNTLIITDFGPSFHGWVGRTVAGHALCVAPPAVRTDPAARRIFRELVQFHGGDCARCTGCVVGGSPRL